MADSASHAGQDDAPVIRMEIAVDFLRDMTTNAALKEDAREGFKLALAVIEPMFRQFIRADTKRKPESEQG